MREQVGSTRRQAVARAVFVVDDALWNALATEFTNEQLIELVALTGFYQMISLVTNAFKIPLESFGPRFATYG